jgi:DNA helicase-2/ATP-dependent DNA helicase PcrA
MIKGEKEDKRHEATKAFDEAYGRLNAAQRKAVDTIEGPVMVIAGPGTGKTQILALRIANILRRTDTSPSSILALTFTESGVASMRSRLVSLIGEAGYRVRVHTFHGFCNEVIRLYPDRFPSVIGRAPLVELDAIAIVKGIIDDLRPALLRPQGKPDYYVRDIISKISEVKREHITPEELKKHIAEERARVESAPDLHHEKGKYKGKMKGAYADALRSLERADQFLLVFEAYEQALAEKGYYDYEDTIISVIEALSRDEELKLMLQEEHQYILADEHQDANGSQNELLVLLSDFHSEPNLFIVGDEKQAIYRFQGASLENFFSFQRRYKDAVLVPLSENYRSTQRILDAAHALVEKVQTGHGDNREKMGERVRLLARALHEDQHITYLCAPDEETEHAHVAKKISECIETGTPPGEIAVLVRRNSEIAPVAEALSRLSIPFVSHGDDPVLAHPVVEGLLVLLKVVAHFGDDRFLYPVLALPYSGISNLDIYRLSAKPRYELGALYALLADKETLESLGVQSIDAAQKLYRFLDDSARALRQMPLAVGLERVYIRSGCLKYVMGRTDALATGDIMRTFFRYVRSLTAAHPAFALPDLLAAIEEAKTYRLAIAGRRYHPAGAVSVMSVHRAKGMEFDHVFVPHVHDRIWGARRVADHLPLPIFSSPDGGRTETAEDDERRLLYVALTRARKTLTLSYAALSDDGVEQVPSRFLTELRDGHMVEENVEPIEHALPVSAQDEIRTTLSEEEKTFLRGVLAERGMSVSGLNEYLAAPWKYFFRHLLRVPDLPAPHLLYGTAVDEALKWYGGERKEGKRPEADDVIGVFVAALARQGLARKDFDTYRERGAAALSGYIAAYADAWVTQSESAVKLRIPFETGIQGMPSIVLRGELDKVEALEDGLLRIVDYKTGKPKTRGFIEGSVKASDGGLKRQLVFYTMLMESDPARAGKTKETMLDFVEPDANGAYHRETYVITSIDVVEIQETIRQVLQEIYEFAFWDTPCDEKTWEKDGCLLVEAIKNRKNLFG